MDKEEIIAEIRSLHSSFSEAKKSNDALMEKFDKRMEEVEHSLFGHEVDSKIGVAERVRNLEDNWAKLTFGASALTLIVLEGGKSLFTHLFGFK